MSAAGVFDNLEHDIATIGVQRVACGEIDSTRVVQCSSVGDYLVRIVAIEGHQIGHLDSFGIYDCQALSFVQSECGARPRRDF